jgi:2,5-diketo-D-gluconate reductase B
MKFEQIGSLRLPKIGFGTSGIGGTMLPNRLQDAAGLAAMRSALELGYTHFDTAEVYASGHSEELLGAAICDSRIPRETLFITSKVSPTHMTYPQVLSACRKSLHRLQMEYLDLYLIHWPLRGLNLGEVFRALNQLVREGLVRHLGVSNFNLPLLKRAAALSQTPLLTNQVSYSLPDRSCVRNGVLGWCQQNDLLLTAYTPLKRRFIKSNHTLQGIARGHGTSPQQVALAWLVSQPRVITIPMSTNPAHQAENLAAADLELDETELDLLGPRLMEDLERRTAHGKK